MGCFLSVQHHLKVPNGVACNIQYFTSCRPWRHHPCKPSCSIRGYRVASGASPQDTVGSNSQRKSHLIQDESVGRGILSSLCWKGELEQLFWTCWKSPRQNFWPAQPWVGGAPADPARTFLLISRRPKRRPTRLWNHRRIPEGDARIFLERPLPGALLFRCKAAWRDLPRCVRHFVFPNALAQQLRGTRELTEQLGPERGRGDAGPQRPQRHSSRRRLQKRCTSAAESAWSPRNPLLGGSLYVLPSAPLREPDASLQRPQQTHSGGGLIKRRGEQEVFELEC